MRTPHVFARHNAYAPVRPACNLGNLLCSPAVPASQHARAYQSVGCKCSFTSRDASATAVQSAAACWLLGSRGYGGRHVGEQDWCGDGASRHQPSVWHVPNGLRYRCGRNSVRHGVCLWRGCSAGCSARIGTSRSAGRGDAHRSCRRCCVEPAASACASRLLQRRLHPEPVVGLGDVHVQLRRRHVLRRLRYEVRVAWLWAVCVLRAVSEGTIAHCGRRTREVVNTALASGQTCVHVPNTDAAPCPDEKCTGKCEISPWVAWSDCTETCGSEGSRTRTRQIAQFLFGPTSTACNTQTTADTSETGPCETTLDCNMPNCFSNFSAWDACGDGKCAETAANQEDTQSRVRTNLLPEDPLCVGEVKETRVCRKQLCGSVETDAPDGSSNTPTTPRTTPTAPPGSDGPGEPGVPTLAPLGQAADEDCCLVNPREDSISVPLADLGASAKIVFSTEAESLQSLVTYSGLPYPIQYVPCSCSVPLHVDASGIAAWAPPPMECTRFACRLQIFEGTSCSPAPNLDKVFESAADALFCSWHRSAAVRIPTLPRITAVPTSCRLAGRAATCPLCKCKRDDP